MSTVQITEILNAGRPENFDYFLRLERSYPFFESSTYAGSTVPMERLGLLKAPYQIHYSSPFGNDLRTHDPDNETTLLLEEPNIWVTLSISSSHLVNWLSVSGCNIWPINELYDVKAPVASIEITPEHRQDPRQYFATPAQEVSQLLVLLSNPEIELDPVFITIFSGRSRQEPEGSASLDLRSALGYFGPVSSCTVVTVFKEGVVLKQPEDEELAGM